MTDPEVVRTVSLTVHVPDEVTVRPGAVLRARVEESSIADRAPDVVARAEKPVAALPADHRLKLDIEVPERLIEQSSSYTVFCHLDTTGSGEVEAGDALTTQSVPVLTHSAPDRAAVDLRAV
jgi:hypothetical protein